MRGFCQAAPELCVLVTSRERLAVEGEEVIELEPLGCPGEGDGDAAVRGSEAVRLLEARAAAAGGELGADPHVLGALVRRLDGIPLAIELLAARTRLLGPAELLARLQQRFERLAQGPREAPRRHATLASAIDWSWNLLPEGEQRALAECSAFAGGFSVEAAERVLSGDAAEVVPRIAALRDKSLLHVSGDDRRLALYVSIRDYAAQRLDERGPAEAFAVRFRHAQHHAAAARAFNLARTFQGAAPDDALRLELTRDRDNLLAALALVRACPLVEAAEIHALAELAIGVTLLQAAPADLCLDALALALTARGRLGDGEIDLGPRILLARQSLLSSMGRYAESRADMAALLAVPGLPPGLRACTLVMKGTQLRYQARYREGWDSHVEAERMLADLDLPRLTAMNLACMGRLAADFRDAPQARAYNERARARCAEIGDRWLEALPLANLAQLEQEEGHLALAAELLDRALVRFREASEPQYEALYSAVRGDLHFECNEPGPARLCYASAARFLSGWMAHRGAAVLYASWSALEAQHGDPLAAEAHLDRARRSAGRGESPIVRLCLELADGSLRLFVARASADRARLARELAAARERLAALQDPASVDHEHVASSLELRFAVRMLARALKNAPDAAPRLAVGRNVAWFDAAGAARVDLLRRGPLRRILAALVEHRRARPEEALGQDALVGHGWPGERLLADAASTRVRVAIATLRRFGLREVLRTRDDGYLLDPAVEVEVEV